MSLPAPGAPFPEYSDASVQGYYDAVDALEDARYLEGHPSDSDSDCEELDVPVPAGLPHALHPAPFANMCRDLLEVRISGFDFDPQALHLLQVSAEHFLGTVYKAGLASGGESVVLDGITAMCARHGPGCACCAPKSKRARKLY